jgi:hypothetical protein
VRKHRWKLLALAGLALASVMAFALWPRPSRVTRATYDRIKAGMSRAEVEAILGPPGDYSSGPTKWVNPRTHEILVTEPWPRMPSHPGPVVSRRDSWHEDEGLISVGYFCGDAVVKDFVPAEREPQPPLDNFRWRAKRQWRRWFP